MLDEINLVEGYLKKLDWRVRENANTTYSLQALNFFVSGEIAKRYWLRKVYPLAAAKAHEKGFIHIHDLAILGPYCVGWDLLDLLKIGFKGAPGKIESRPARHFRVALGQAVNFIYTMQGEAAGAQAFSDFDVFLAPFIYYDKLSYEQVKQALQEFVYNMNVPTRVGFQCLSEDTKILTPEGWKSYKEVKEGSIIYTFNLKTKKIEKKPVKSVFVRKYKGIMYNLRNRSQDQLVSPGHRIVRKVFNSNEYVLEPIEDVLKLKSPILIPVAAENCFPDYNISDEELKLIAWILSEGSIEKEGSYRISIYQSKKAHPENYKEIINLLKKLGLDFEVRSQKSWGRCEHIRLSPASSKKVHELLGKEKKFPDFLFKLSKRQARLFLETYLKGDGWVEKNRKRIVTTEKEFLEALEALAVLAGFNFSVTERKPQGSSKKTQYVLTLTETKHDSIQSIEKVYYEGIIWSVHTENETVIAKRNGQVFITGNTPFSNVTMDVKIPPNLKDMPAVVGGKEQSMVYGDFEEEVEMLNKAFAEVMSEGDAKGRPFTFPIPTYNIARDWDWSSEVHWEIMEMTAKYGIPYFANFVNSDLKPEDVRSMCCRLRLNTKELKKRIGGLFASAPLTGSIGVVTLNMGRIGYLSKDDSDFFEYVENLMNVAKDALLAKREFIEKMTEAGLYPYSKFYLRSIKAMEGSYWVHHFNTIGLIGMNEGLVNFMQQSIVEPEAKKFAEKVLDFMLGKLIEFQEETNLLWNLEATPGEGASYRLAKIDKEEFKDIYTAGEKVPYYTNSTWAPVDYTDDIFELLEHQESLQTKYTGGTVVHIWLGEAPSKEAISNLLYKIIHKFKIPYYTITPTYSICPIHGYIPGKHEYCPYPHSKEDLIKAGLIEPKNSLVSFNV